MHSRGRPQKPAPLPDTGVQRASDNTGTPTGHSGRPKTPAPLPDMRPSYNTGTPAAHGGRNKENSRSPYSHT